MADFEEYRREYEQDSASDYDNYRFYYDGLARERAERDRQQEARLLEAGSWTTGDHDDTDRSYSSRAESYASARNRSGTGGGLGCLLVLVGALVWAVRGCGSDTATRTAATQSNNALVAPGAPSRRAAKKPPVTTWKPGAKHRTGSPRKTSASVRAEPRVSLVTPSPAPKPEPATTAAGTVGAPSQDITPITSGAQHVPPTVAPMDSAKAQNAVTQRYSRPTDSPLLRRSGAPDSAQPTDYGIRDSPLLRRFGRP